MIKTYEYSLPKDHFNNLYEKVAIHLVKGENVLISAIYGCGSSIFLNLFLRLNNESGLFPKVYFYNPITNKVSITKYVKNIQKEDIGQKLLIIRLFEKIGNKKKILEELHSLKQPNPESITYLIFSDHTGFTNIKDFVATSTPFFNGRFFIGPFDYDSTRKMIEINSKFFGWNTKPHLYKEIYRLSGGVPRMIKHIAREIDEGKNKITDLEWFLRHPSIKFELDSLADIFRQERIPELTRLGLIDKNKKIKSYLLEKHLEKYRSEIVSSLYPTLPNLEAKLLSFLHENKDQIITVDQIGDFMELNGREFSPWAIYKLISRLKIKIKNNFEIENLKGRGYILRLTSI